MKMKSLGEAFFKKNVSYPFKIYFQINEINKNEYFLSTNESKKYASPII